MSVFESARGVPLLLVPDKSLNGPFNAELLGKILSVAGCENVLISSFFESLSRIDSSDISALIVCGWEPSDDRIKVLSGIRALLPSLPILVIGQSDSAEDRVAAFEAGADNYLPASFIEPEMVAKLNRLLSRTDVSVPSVSIADLQVWSESRVVFRAGMPIKLSSKELDLLLCLVAHKSKPVSHTKILNDVFGLSFEPGTNVVAVHIHRLRQKIDRGHGRQLLKTVRGRGYALG